MRLPAKIEYACKAAIELGLRYDGSKPINLGEISKAQNIPREFLVQLFIRLKSACVVNSVRGIEGGYYLTRDPSRVSLADIVSAVDDSIIGTNKKVERSVPGDAGSLIADVWMVINAEISRQMEHVTLEQLIAKLKNEQVTYYI